MQRATALMPGSQERTYLGNRALARQLKRMFPCTSTDDEDLHVNRR